MPDATNRGVISSIFKWLGRIGSIIIIAGILAFYIGEGGFTPSRLTTIELIMKVLLISSCAGLVLGWRWEGVGGAISTLFMLAFFLVNFARSGSFPGGWAFEIIAMPGVFFLMAALSSGAGSAGKRSEKAVT